MKRLLLVIMLLLPLFAFAEAVGGPDKEPRDNKQWNEQLETVLIARLTRMLDLKSDQAKEFFPLFNDFQEKGRQLRRERQDAMMRIRQFGDPGATPSMVEVQRAVRDLSEIGRKQVDALQLFSDQSAKVLSPRQIARLNLFMIKFPERLEQILRERKGMGGPGQHFRGGRDAPPDDDE